MADGVTDNYNFTEPEVGFSDGSWGGKLNANWDSIDTLLASAFDPPETPDGTLGTLKPDAYGGNTEIAGSNPQLRFHDTDRPEPGGRYRWFGTGENFRLDKATTTDWSTSDVILSYVPTEGLTLSDGAITVETATASGLALKLPGSDPDITAWFTTAMLDSVDGVRMRFSGSLAGGVFQLSDRDAGKLELAPGDRSIEGAADNGDRGIAFKSGISLNNESTYQLGGVGLGILPFLTTNLTEGNTFDIGPVGDFAVDTNQRVRLFRNMTGGTGRFQLLDPGTTTAMVSLDSEGNIYAAKSGQFGAVLVNASADGTQATGKITSTKTSARSEFVNAGRGSGQGQWSFISSDGAEVAHVDGGGTLASSGVTIMTREKGDARYNQLSSIRYKENPEIPAPAMWSNLIDGLDLKRWVWGGDLPDSDPRAGRMGAGLIAEEVAEVFPAAVRYDDEDNIDGLDPLALIGMLVEEVKALRSRVSDLEG